MSGAPRLIVVGAGTAGLACAIEAAAAGAEVVLLEKDDVIGGSLHVSGGHLSAAGTRRQRSRGIVDTPDEHLADVMRISDGTAREDLTELAVRLAAETVDLLDEAGFDFAPETPRLFYGHEPYGIARTYYGTDEARSILRILERQLAAAVDDGRVTVRTGTRVERLLVENGRVVGVVADGTETRADAVVLTTGGFAAAPELFAELEQAHLVSAARPTSTGDGLVMAREIGAAVAGRGHWLPTFGGMPSEEDPDRVVWHDRPILFSDRDPVEIYVDRTGHRFVAEDEPSIDEKERRLATTPDMTFWVVFDDRQLTESAEGLPFVRGWDPDRIRELAGTHPAVFSADTLPELGAAAGIGPALADTVAGYNAAVASGHDAEFGRTHMPSPITEGPFYALQNHGITLVTFAGVDVTGDLQVRREDGTPVAGLYAAGEVLGAVATTGGAFCSGMLITPALSFGRHVGRSLAQSTSTTMGSVRS